MSCWSASQSYLIDHCGINPLLSNIHFISRHEISLFQFLEAWKMLCFNFSIQMKFWCHILHGIFFKKIFLDPYHFEKYTKYCRFRDQILNFNLETPSWKHTIVKIKNIYSCTDLALWYLALSLHTVHILIRFFLHGSLLVSSFEWRLLLPFKIILLTIFCHLSNPGVQWILLYIARVQFFLQLWSYMFVH